MSVKPLTPAEMFLKYAEHKLEEEKGFRNLVNEYPHLFKKQV